jgi:hypothetical protein
MQYHSVFYFSVLPENNAGMTTEHIDAPDVAQRRRQLWQWLLDNFGGSQTAFLDDLQERGHEMNQGELSGLLKKKSFGEKKARSLETKAGMPHRYLNPTFDVVELRLREQATTAYLWPFATITPDLYNNVLRDMDRAIIETMAMTLLEARANSEKHAPPAYNTIDKSAAA